MKKTFSAKRNRLLSSTDFSWGAYALAIVGGMLLLRVLAPSFFWTVWAPVFRVSDAVAGSTHAFFSSFGNAAALAKRNEQLEIENAALAAQNDTLVQQASGIARLTVSGTNPTGLVAGIVARPPQSPYDTLLIAAGAAEGVTEGMEAFAQGGVPVGTVSAVFDHYTRITLFSASGVLTSGWVSQAQVPLTLEGAGGGSLRALVPRAAGIVAGDVVYVPGPGMLAIGSVARVDSDPSLPGVTLRIQSTFNLFALSWVELRDTGAQFVQLGTSTAAKL